MTFLGQETRMTFWIAWSLLVQYTCTVTCIHSLHCILYSSAAITSQWIASLQSVTLSLICSCLCIQWDMHEICQNGNFSIIYVCVCIGRYSTVCVYMYSTCMRHWLHVHVHVWGTGYMHMYIGCTLLYDFIIISVVLSTARAVHRSPSAVHCEWPDLSSHSNWVLWYCCCTTGTNSQGGQNSISYNRCRQVQVLLLYIYIQYKYITFLQYITLVGKHAAAWQLE